MREVEARAPEVEAGVPEAEAGALEMEADVPEVDCEHFAAPGSAAPRHSAAREVTRRTSPERRARGVSVTLWGKRSAVRHERGRGEGSARAWRSRGPTTEASRQAHDGQRSTWPPSAGVRHCPMSVSTRFCPHVSGCLDSRSARWARTRSAMSYLACPVLAGPALTAAPGLARAEGRADSAPSAPAPPRRACSASSSAGCCGRAAPG